MFSSSFSLAEWVAATIEHDEKKAGDLVSRIVSNYEIVAFVDGCQTSLINRHRLDLRADDLF